MLTDISSLGISINFFFLSKLLVLEKLKIQDPIDHLKYAFKIFTAESSIGKIRLEDLERINCKIGSNLTHDEMQLMIKEFDKNEDDSSKTIMSCSSYKIF